MPPVGSSIAVNICESFGLSEPPEVAFDVITDPNTASRWLPGLVRVERLDEHRLRAVIDRAEYEIRLNGDAMRLTWWPVNGLEPRGSVQVQSGPAGGALVRVTITAADDVDSPRRVHAVLDRMVRALESDLADRLSAS